MNINLDSDNNKNSNFQDSSDPKMPPKLSSRRTPAYANPEALDSRIFPGEIHLEELSENNEVNKVEWEKNRRNFEGKPVEPLRFD